MYGETIFSPPKAGHVRRRGGDRLRTPKTTMFRSCKETIATTNELLGTNSMVNILTSGYCRVHMQPVHISRWDCYAYRPSRFCRLTISGTGYN